MNTNRVILEVNFDKIGEIAKYIDVLDGENFVEGDV